MEGEDEQNWNTIYVDKEISQQNPHVQLLYTNKNV
jgi:hypothetical protein